MSRNRIAYNSLGLFVGPSPETGYHFLDYSGNLNDDYLNTSSNYNLLFPISRVQDFNYGIKSNRTEIREIGKRGTVARSIINPYSIDFNFSYLQYGIVNELRLGFYANYTQIYGTNSGLAFYPNNTGVFLLSGFVDRNLIRTNNELQWPYTYRDKRNLFLAINTVEGFDLNNQTTYNNIDVNSSGFGVLAFGNCYISSYKTEAAVSSLPKATVSYVAENINFDTSGSGAAIPALNTTTRNLVSGVHYCIPTTFQGSNLTAAIMPGDITLSISSYPSLTGQYVLPQWNNTGQYNITTNPYPAVQDLCGIDLNDVKIQGYSIDMIFNRETLNGLSFKLPVDRQINFPTFANVKIDLIVGANQSGSIANAMNKNDDYNLTIKLKNPSWTTGQYRAGGIAVQHDFLRAKFEDINWRAGIGQNVAASCSFICDLDPQDYSRGYFMSGLLNTDVQSVATNYLLKEDGFYLLQEDGSKIIVSILPSHVLLY